MKHYVVEFTNPKTGRTHGTTIYDQSLRTVMAENKATMPNLKIVGGNQWKPAHVDHHEVNYNNDGYDRI